MRVIPAGGSSYIARTAFRLLQTLGPLMERVALVSMAMASCRSLSSPSGSLLLLTTDRRDDQLRLLAKLQRGCIGGGTIEACPTREDWWRPLLRVPAVARFSKGTCPP